MRSATAKEAVELLNEVLRLEPEALADLCRTRVFFDSEELADHPTVQVGLTPEGVGKRYTLSLVGLLNGIFGSPKDRIAIMVDDDFYEDPDAPIERFVAYSDFQERTEA